MVYKIENLGTVKNEHEKEQIFRAVIFKAVFFVSKIDNVHDQISVNLKKTHAGNNELCHTHTLRKQILLFHRT